jgi:predicted Rossmann fold nucleotide-binding protein DprA/Smf involved in DNA uptake
MTKKEMFSKIATVCSADAEIVEFCNHEIALLVKKNSYKSTKPTKTQIENEGLKDAILNALDKPMTATEIGSAVGISVNKASALLKQLHEDNSIVREVVKRKAYFSKA